MYVRNLNQTSIPAFQCGSYLAIYLIKHDLPLLSQKDGIFYFADTETLRNTLEKSPLWIKVLRNINNGFSF